MSFLQTPSLQIPGVKPRSPKALVVWQTDVTHYAPFGSYNYIFVTVDTFSTAAQTVTHAMERNKHALSFFAVFPMLGLPHEVKTDNRTYVVSKALEEFVYKIEHHPLHGHSICPPPKPSHCREF